MMITIDVLVLLDSIGLTFCDFTIVNNKAVCNNADALTQYEE
jgi:hypothetical protein